MNAADLFFQWLLFASLRASVLALAVLGLQFSLRRWLPARWRHALWLPVVLVLMAPMLPKSRFSAENGFIAKPAVAPAGPASATVRESLIAPQAVTKPPGFAGSAPWQPDGRKLLFATWLLGVCAVLVAGGGGYRRSLRRISRGTVVTSAQVQESVARVADQLGLKRLPRVVMSSVVNSPAVAGLLRPVLFLPASFPNGFSAAEARLVLLHELIHLKRHDLPLNWLLCGLQALHWFNPLLWLAFARMRVDRETACDAQVLGADAEDRRAAYGHALLKLQNSASLPGLSLAFIGIFDRGGMRSRIRAIAGHRRSHPAWGCAAASIIAALTLVGATRAQDAKTDRPADALQANTTQNTDQKDKAGWGHFVSFQDGTLTLKGKDGEIGMKKAAVADNAGNTTPAANPPDQQEKSGYGKFVSFQDGTLTLKGNYSGLVWHNIPEKTPVVHWDDAAGKYVPSGTAEVLGKVEAGTWIIVGGNKALIRVGARKGRTTGTFVSFKNERLLMLGKDLGPSYTKKYGNQLHMNKFADDVPVYESIDGGDFEFVGNPAKVLPNVKEGAIVTVYGAGDDNITRIEIGVPKK
jgi:beta-lactamase regulating signal transducer with metallopeptidase domain